MKHLKTIFILALISIFALSGFAWAGTPKRLKYGARFRDEGAAHSTPPSGFGDLYVNSDTLYFINDSGVGQTTRVPIDDFMSAWSSKGYNAIASKKEMKL